MAPMRVRSRDWASPHSSRLGDVRLRQRRKLSQWRLQESPNRSRFLFCFCGAMKHVVGHKSARNMEFRINLSNIIGLVSG